MTRFASAQAYMKSHGIDAWLVYDFRGSNQVFSLLLPAPPGIKRFTTRRIYLLIPANGGARMLVHGIDQFGMEREGHKDVAIDAYLAWPEIRAWLQRQFSGAKRVAMEYVPGGVLPVAAIVDAGTVEMVRSVGVEVVSSADLMQASAAVWPVESVKLHEGASKKTGAIVAAAFDLIRKRHAGNQAIEEHVVAEFIRERFKAEGLESPDGPIVAVNGHAADPHYEPTPASPTPIKKGDWVLIDLWAREPGDQNIFSDITWVGFCGPKVPARHQQVWQVVKGARDAAVARSQAAWKAGERVQGWQLDEAAREVIIKAGLQNGIRHRTGHSLSPGPMVHGLGMNLDNLETHDTREMLPGIGFTVEPGVYLPEENFGIRSEVNVYVDPNRGPVVTSVVQAEPVVMG